MITGPLLSNILDCGLTMVAEKKGSVRIRSKDKAVEDFSTRNMKKIPLFLILLSFLVCGCQKESSEPFAVIDITITNHRFLDSLIIYDKERSWSIISTFRFNQANKQIDTLVVDKTKRYPFYSFTQGVQKDIGEIMIAPKGKISISIDEKAPMESIFYKGRFERSNNFLAYSNYYQNQLAETVRDGIDQKNLENLIQDRSSQIKKKGKSLNIADSLLAYVNEDFNRFSETLQKKNEKYLYKRSLVNKIGNQFSFKDRNKANVSLEKYRGKYLYIDVWATWCKPCIVEYPYLKELEKQFSANSDLQIISVSTDKDFQKWQDHLEKKSIDGVQLYSGPESDFVTFYDIGALPRFIFLDQTGRIITPDELRPSDANLAKKINAVMNDSLKE